MFDMVTPPSLDIHTQALVQIRTQMAPVEEEAKKIHESQVENHIKLIELTEKAWGHKLQQVFPGVPVVERHCISEITPQDPINKAGELPAMLQKMGLIVTQIEYDAPRNTYRLYGRKSAPPMAPGIPSGQAPRH